MLRRLPRPGCRIGLDHRTERPRIGGLWTARGPVVLVAAVAVAGCGPSLKRQETYSVRKVRQITFADRCGLQEHFDANPPPLKRSSELAIGNERKTDRSMGKVTFRVDNWAHRETFFRLLDQIYRDVPPFNRDKPVRVTVPFYQRGHYTHVPLGAEFTVRTSAGQFTLPYAPCMAFFFFGRDYYRARREVLTSGRDAPAVQDRATVNVEQKTN